MDGYTKRKVTAQANNVSTQYFAAWGHYRGRKR